MKKLELIQYLESIKGNPDIIICNLPDPTGKSDEEMELIKWGNPTLHDGKERISILIYQVGKLSNHQFKKAKQSK